MTVPRNSRRTASHLGRVSRNAAMSPRIVPSIRMTADAETAYLNGIAFGLSRPSALWEADIFLSAWGALSDPFFVFSWRPKTSPIPEVGERESTGAGRNPRVPGDARSV